MDKLSTEFKTFHNGHQALAVRTNGNIPPNQIVRALRLPHYSALLMISGGAGGMLTEVFVRLVSLFDEIGQTVSKNNIAVVDGGTQSGVMKLMGQALAKSGRTTAHVGVVPAYAEAGNGLVAQDILEPNHSGFVLVNGHQWGDEVETMYSLAAYMSENVPSVTILVNGGGISLLEIEWNVRQGREIVVIAGSGRLADEIADAVRHPNSNIRERVEAVVRDGRLTLFDISDPPASLIHILEQRLLLQR